MDDVHAMVFGLVRHAGTAFAGYLVSHGFITGDATNDVLGICVGAAGIIWSILHKKGMAP